MFDCWPVHCSKDFRDWVAENCPCFELMYIPYGRTGDYQINDTHLHKPVKGAQTNEASAWHMRHLRKFRAQATVDKAKANGDAAKIALVDKELAAKLNRLMGIRILREQSPVWLRKSLESIVTVNAETGMNLIRKGWVSIV